MPRHQLTDEEWELIEDVFPPRANTGRPPVDRRKVLNGIFWVLRTGAPWRDVPEEFGKWHTIWDLFDKWNDAGLLDEILRRLRAAKVDVGDIDQDLWCIDGSVVRAARCTAGGAKKGTRRSLLTTR
jgi:transposase